MTLRPSLASMVTDDQRRAGFKAVVNDFAATICREIDAAPDHDTLMEIGQRISKLPELVTRVLPVPAVVPPAPPPPAYP